MLGEVRYFSLNDHRSQIVSKKAWLSKSKEKLLELIDIFKKTSESICCLLSLPFVGVMEETDLLKIFCF